MKTEIATLPARTSQQPLAVIQTLDGSDRALPSDLVLLETRTGLSSLDMDYRALAEKKRELSKAFVANGGNRRVLQFIRMLDKMDPDDRIEFMAELEVYLEFLRYRGDFCG